MVEDIKKEILILVNDKINQLKQSLKINAVKMGIAFDGQEIYDNFYSIFLAAFKKVKTQSLRLQYSTKIKNLFNDSCDLLILFLKEIKKELSN